MEKPHCKVCCTKHWLSEGHKFKDAVADDGFVDDPSPASVPVKIVPSVGPEWSTRDEFRALRREYMRAYRKRVK